MSLLIIVPAYNEATVISKTIIGIQKFGKKLGASILVVDDGSTDGTGDKLSKLDVYYVRHIVNRGLGGAIGTGLEYAKRNGYQYAITIDADGQHDPKDIEKVLAPLKSNQADIVIGSRFLYTDLTMPKDRQFLLGVSNLLTLLLFRQKTTDSLSGFRGFNRKTIDNLRIKTERMEVSNEFFSEIKRLRLRLEEVPIKVLYTQYSRSKGQTNSNAINIVIKLVMRLFR